MRLVAILVLVSIAIVYVTAEASAATDGFGFEDPALDAIPPPVNAWADLVSGRLVVADDGSLHATLVLSALPEMQPGVAYVFIFSDGERDHFAGAVTAPNLDYIYGLWKDGPIDAKQTTGSYTTGPGGSVGVVFPREALANATTLSAPRGFTADIKPGALPGSPFPAIPLDEAAGDATLELGGSPSASDGAAPGRTTPAQPTATSGAPPEGDDARSVPALGVTALVGVALAVGLARRR